MTTRPRHRGHRSGHSLRWAARAAMALTAVAILGLVASRPGSSAASLAGPAAVPSAGWIAEPPADPAQQAHAALLSWSHRRSAIFANAVVADLRSLYRDLDLARADQELLAAYRLRGVQVTGMTMEVASLRVVARESDRLVLVVLGRTVPGFASTAYGVWSLPRPGLQCREWELLLVDQSWQVARIKPSDDCAAPSSGSR